MTLFSSWTESRLEGRAMTGGGGLEPRVVRFLLFVAHPQEAEPLLQIFSSAGISPRAAVAASFDEFTTQLKSEPFDLILCRLKLGRDTADALRLVRLSGSRVPFILISRVPNEDLRVEHIREGATEILSEDQLNLLPKAVLGALRCEHQPRQSDPSSVDLQQGDYGYHLLFDFNPLPMYVLDLDSLRFLAVNRAMLRHYGYTEDEFLAMSAFDIRPDEDAEPFLKSLHDGVPGLKGVGIWRHKLKNGNLVCAEITRCPLPFRGHNALLVLIHDVTELKRSEEQLQQSEERFAKAFRSSPLAITISTETEGRYVDVNDAFLQLVGLTREDVVGHTTEELHIWQFPEDRNKVLRDLHLPGADTTFVETVVNSRTQGKRTVQIFADLIPIEGVPCLLAISKDITESRSMERQIREAQKMEAVGQLAAGVAHDFNNLIMVIESYVHLIKKRVHDPERVRRYATLIDEAVVRSSTLTKQLLTFGRKQAQELQTWNLNVIVSGFGSMLSQMLPENIHTSLALHATGEVLADRAQIEQVLVNLVLNARDAMEHGGTLTIETADVHLTEPYARTHGASIRPGDYQMIAVIDTGTGMDETTQARIFEPFFTTKPVGKGTGLGLATAYGIANQHGGCIWAYSEVGRGTTIKIYLPRAIGNTVALPVEMPSNLSEEGTETVLLVEDQQGLREVIAEYLRAKGYKVIAAANGAEAESTCRSASFPVDVLVTDVVMPGDSGSEVARQVRQQFPAVKIIYMSGYSDRNLAFERSEATAFLEKPFDLPKLTHSIRRLMATVQRH